MKKVLENCIEPTELFSAFFFDEWSSRGVLKNAFLMCILAYVRCTLHTMKPWNDWWGNADASHILWRILAKPCGGPSDFLYAPVVRIDRYKKSTHSATRNHLVHTLFRTEDIYDLDLHLQLLDQITTTLVPAKNTQYGLELDHQLGGQRHSDISPPELIDNFIRLQFLTKQTRTLSIESLRLRFPVKDLILRAWELVRYGTWLSWVIGRYFVHDSWARDISHCHMGPGTQHQTRKDFPNDTPVIESG